MAKPDKATMLAYLDELGFSDALKANVIQELEADENRANAFVGQRLRHADYTKKTQELADQRKSLEGSVATQVQEYATRLQQAETKMNQILRDLEQEKISRTTAEQRLQRVKTQYELSDDDIPPVHVAEPPARTSLDIDQKLTEFKTQFGKELTEKFVKEIMPELMSFPQISALQQDIIAEHQALTGKRLTAKDLNELTALAPKAGGLYKAWEEKYGIADIRQQKHDEELTAKNRREWEDEARRRASEDALAGVRPRETGESQFSTSPVLRGYRDRSKEETAEPAGNGKGKEATPAPRLSGAERAAAKFVERRNQGIPLGKEAPAVARQ